MNSQSHYVCSNLSKMSIQSKRSNISEKNSQKNFSQIRDYTNLDPMDIENGGSGGLLKKLSQSDNNKKSSMVGEDTYDTVDCKISGQKLNLYKCSDRQIQSSLKLPKSNISEENDLHHECTCMKLNKASYCPMFCDCYEFPEKCSEQLCCKQCFAVKQIRLPSIVEKTLGGKVKDSDYRHGLNHYDKKNRQSKKRNQANQDSTNIFEDISGFISGSEQIPVTFGKTKCFCRNSKCQKGYCVCFKGKQQCSEECQCQPNCNNCSPQVKAIKMKQFMVPQSSTNNNLRETGSSADSHISFEKFQYRM